MWFNNKYVMGAVSGVIAAAAVDYGAFRSWKSVQDALAYNWKLAAWRWCQGAVAGVITAAGFGFGEV